MHCFKTFATIVILSAATPIVKAERATIAVPEVEVQSGPGSAFYATDKLRRGATVEVISTQGDYLAIKPPRNSYSLIAKADVQRSGDSGIVLREGADTLIGSRLSDSSTARAARLSKGAIVTILGETKLSAEQGGTESYYIAPTADEKRYIPVSAVRQPQTIVQASAQAPSPDDGPVGAMLQQASEAYKTAQATGDWSEAKRIYEELAKSTNHEARMIACNRLEFIRTRGNAGARAIRQMPAQAPSSFVPRYSQQQSPFNARIAPQYQRLDNTPEQRVLPRSPMPAAPAARVPVVQAFQSRSANPTEQSQYGGQTGFLRRGFRKLADGRPLYLLEDGRGVLRCYVAPSGGLNLEPFVLRNVEIQGAQMVYHSALRGYLVEATQVTPLTGN